MLDADAIRREAEQREGREDADAASLQDNLRALVASINADSGLPDWGEAITHNGLVDRFADRLAAQRWVTDYPEIAAEVIDRPVFLTGLPRSGTTFFQYLFDRDDRFRLIRTWEAITPQPPPGFDPASVQQRKREEAERRAAARPMVEGFDALHLMDADGPEECHAFMEHASAAAGFHNLLDVPGYFDYLRDDLDFTAAYAVHKRQLQLLQWRTPACRWALKYPAHVLAMDAILRVHPSASFVMTHRDPVQTLASLCKLTHLLRSARCDTPAEPARVGRQMRAFMRLHIDRILAFARGADANRVVHVDYYRLLDDPAGAMREVHAGLGIDSPQAVRDAVARWHRDNPKGARGANPYALEEYGLVAEEVAEDYGDYMDFFDIPREAVGLARGS
ncbi:sulfotransferase family protein [Mangrovimicrobium sediminis]|uniref:sulfotransferase family protein n=1 Tax=Mangrovimicrobium sediminis TaxID=2562682 RepID=UPI0014368A09|nr:sulfotransferase [Haliea sp. SAOS-164]